MSGVPSVTELAQNLDCIKLVAKQTRATKDVPAKTEPRFVYDISSTSKVRKTSDALTFTVSKVALFFKHYPANPKENKPEMYRMVCQCKDSDEGDAFLAVVGRCEQLLSNLTEADYERTPEEEAMREVISYTEKIKGVSTKSYSELQTSLLYDDDNKPAAIKKLWKFDGEKPKSAANKPGFLILEKFDVDPEDIEKYKLRRVAIWNKDAEKIEAKLKKLVRGDWTATDFKNTFTNFWRVDEMTVSIPYIYNMSKKTGLLIFFKDIAMYREKGNRDETGIFGDDRRYEESTEEETPNENFGSSNSRGITYE